MRSTAEEHEAAAAPRYRAAETKVQDHAQGAAHAAIASGLSKLHGVRGLRMGSVAGQQATTRDRNAAERQRITSTITGIKDRTRTAVDELLKSMEKDAEDIFAAGLGRAEKAYEDTFEDAKGGVGTWLTTWGSDWEKLIENSLHTARREYLRQVDVAIDEVADRVESKLKAAKARVAEGRKEVETFVKGLDDSVRQFGEDALQKVSADFDSMGSDIDQRRDALINKLADQYKASYERMSAMEDKLREENKSLWQRVYDATVGLIKKIMRVQGHAARHPREGRRCHQRHHRRPDRLPWQPCVGRDARAEELHQQHRDPPQEGPDGLALRRAGRGGTCPARYVRSQGHRRASCSRCSD